MFTDCVHTTNTPIKSGYFYDFLSLKQIALKPELGLLFFATVVEWLLKLNQVLQLDNTLLLNVNWLNWHTLIQSGAISVVVVVVIAAAVSGVVVYCFLYKIPKQKISLSQNSDREPQTTTKIH